MDCETHMECDSVVPMCTNLVRVIGGGVVGDVTVQLVDVTIPLPCDKDVLDGPSSRVRGKSWYKLCGIVSHWLNHI